MWSGADGATDNERENSDGDHIADDRGLVAFNGIGTPTGAPHMNTRLVASILALLVSGSAAHASMTLSSWQPAQKAAATTTSTATTTGTATTPSEVAPGKAHAPVSPRTVAKPSVDTPATSTATGRSAGSKRD